MANCYWPGGGKEGQFSPNFGQRNQVNLATSAATPTQPEHFVLSAQVPSSSEQSGILIDVPTNHSPMVLISQGFQTFQKGKIPTFMNSGTSNTMFVSREVFTEYKPITPCVGDSAKAENGNSEIISKGNVCQCYWVDGEECDVTYTHALHTPSLNANLVSVSALDKARLTTVFNNGRGVTKKADGTVILVSQNINGMYLLETVDDPVPQPLALSSLSQLTSLEQWHQHFTHCSPLMIQNMATNNLVDGLDVSETAINGKCKNCILGRQMRCPFNGTTEVDLVPLELVAFDLWVLHLPFSYPIFPIFFLFHLTHTQPCIATPFIYVFHSAYSWGCVPHLYNMLNHDDSSPLWLISTYINPRVAICTLVYSWESTITFSSALHSQSLPVNNNCTKAQTLNSIVDCGS